MNLFSAILTIGCSSGTKDEDINPIEDSSSSHSEPSSDTAPPQDTAQIPSEPLKYADALFKSSNSSYSGGERGSITDQLDAGVRGIEFDIHNDDFALVGDFQIGSDAPGSNVQLAGGNPELPHLSSWLNELNSWSNQHPNHAPITITLTLQDTFIETKQASQGSMYALNQTLKDELGEKLYSAKHHNETGWPIVEDMRDMFVVVLSGDID